MSECQTCVLVENRRRQDVPIWDSIFPSRYFDVAHAFSTSLPGWIVIVCKRHVEAIDELSVEESRELGELIQLVSKGLKHAVGCSKTYVMQFAEMPGHNHVHFHVVPRMADIPEESKGPKVFNYLSVEPALEISEAERNDVAIKMREVQGAI